MGFLDNPRQGGEFGVIPRHDNGRAFDQRKIELLADTEIFRIACLHAAELKAFGRGIKARVQQRAVALGGTGQNIASAFQQNAFQPGNGKAAQDGKPHDASANHCDIESLLHHHSAITKENWQHGSALIIHGDHLFAGY